MITLLTWGLLWFPGGVCDIDVACRAEQCEANIVGKCPARTGEVLNGYVTISGRSKTYIVLGSQNAKHPRYFEFEK